MVVSIAMVMAASTTGGGPPPARPVPPVTAGQSFSALMEEPLSSDFVDRYIGRAYDSGDPLRLDAPEFVGTVKPGLFTLLREIGTGRKLPIDHSDYYRAVNPYIRDLDRRNGITFRDPCHWP